MTLPHVKQFLFPIFVSLRWSVKILFCHFAMPNCFIPFLTTHPVFNYQLLGLLFQRLPHKSPPCCTSANLLTSRPPFCLCIPYCLLWQGSATFADQKQTLQDMGGVLIFHQQFRSFFCVGIYGILIRWPPDFHRS